MSKSGIDTRSGLRNRSNKQAEAQRVEIGDRQGPGDDRAGSRAASGTDRDALALRPLDDVGDDQEIAGKAHPDDRVRARIRGARDRVSRRSSPISARGEPLLQPGLRGAAQCGFLVEAVDRREGRQNRLARLRNEGAAPGDDECVVAGLGQIGEERPASPPPIGSNGAGVSRLRSWSATTVVSATQSSASCAS